MTDKDKMSGKVKKLRYGFIRMTPHIRNHIIYKFEDLKKFRYFTISAIEREKKSLHSRVHR